MKKKAEVEFRVNAVAEHLERGESTATIASEFMPLWGITRRTIGNYIALAKGIVAERNNSKQALVQEARKDAITLAERQNILSDLELEQTLCSIVRGELELEKKVVVNGTEKVIKYKPSHYEIVLAIDKLWKKRGSYPVEKKQVENQNVIIQYNLQKPEDIRYIDGV